jgi:hypothetical protein
MTEHHHDHPASKKEGRSEDGKPHRRRLHKDWRAWLVVALMLAAVIIYVLTLDESILPFALGK